jgi:acyl-coenzyme A synthetase/AMP-(fatty) acid ligase
MEILNAADYLVDRHVREGRGDHTAVVTSERTLTYAELATEVRRVAAGLRDLGVRPEERVLFCMADDIELLSGLLAAMYLGAVPVPVSTMLTGGELGKVLADSRARVLSVSTEFAQAGATAVGIAPEVTDVVLDGPVAFDTRPGVSVHKWFQGNETVPPYPAWADSPALWLYTSGTTGQPKVAMRRHGAIREVATAYGTGVLDIGAGDRCLSVAKLFSAYDIGNSCFFPLSVGGSTVLVRDRPTPAGVAERVRADRPTLFFAVPTFYAALLASDIPDGTFAGVRLGVSAEEALPSALYQRLRDRFGHEVLDGIVLRGVPRALGGRDGLAARAGRPDQRHVPGEADPRHRRLPRDPRSRAGGLPGGPGGAVRTHLPARPPGRETRPNRRVLCGHQPRRRDGAGESGDHHRRGRHLHPASAARRAGVRG